MRTNPEFGSVRIGSLSSVKSVLLVTVTTIARAFAMFVAEYLIYKTCRKVNDSLVGGEKMPTNFVHSVFTYRRYGVGGSDIHSWMDSPSRDLGKIHRLLRHDYDDWIPQRFVRKYGLWKAKAIMRSHIYRDRNWHWLKKIFWR